MELLNCKNFTCNLQHKHWVTLLKIILNLYSIFFLLIMNSLLILEALCLFSVFINLNFPLLKLNKDECLFLVNVVSFIIKFYMSLKHNSICWMWKSGMKILQFHSCRFKNLNKLKSNSKSRNLTPCYFEVHTGGGSIFDLSQGRNLSPSIVYLLPCI